MNDDIVAFLREIEIAQGASKHTVRNYACDLYALYEYLHSNRITSWTEASRDSILDYFESLKKRGLKPTSLQRKSAAFRKFFSYLVDKKSIESSPAFKICSSRAYRSLPNVLSIEKVDSLVRAAAGQKKTGLRDAAVIEMLYSSGVRVGELVKIRCDQLVGDFLKVVGKGSKEREVYIGKPAYLACIKYLGSLHVKMRNALLFPFTERTVENILARTSLLALIDPPATPHTLRHSHATHIYEKTGDLRFVQEDLGHENIQTTTIYTRLDREHKRRTFKQAHPRSKL